MAPERPDRLERWTDRAAADLGAGRPVGLGWRPVAAAAVALGALTAWALVGALGVAAFIWTHPVFWLFGAGLVAMCVAGWPRGADIRPAEDDGGPTTEVAVPPAAAPGLHALVAQVASVAGAPEPARLVATPAPVLSVTGGRRSTLVVGTPLWGLLVPQARVAWLARELVTAAPRRRPGTALVDLADRSLAQWQRQLGRDPAEGSLGRLGRPAHELMKVDPLATHYVLRSEVSATRRSRDQLMGVFHLMLGGTLGTLHRLLRRLAYRSRQRAALEADAVAVRVAGAAGAAAALDTVPLLRRAALSSGQAARRRDPVSFRDTVVGHVLSVPPEECDRLRAEAEAGRCRPDDTVPPLRLRRRLVAARPEAPAAVTLSPEAEIAIDTELAAAVLPVEEALRAAARRRDRRVG